MFSRHGGAVPPGFTLTMASSVAVTGQAATIYYTLDGKDPRRSGGVKEPSARTFAGPVALDQIVTVKARARNDTTGEWSALTEATFAIAAVPASSNNLAIAELMYHPPAVTAAEATAGYSDPDDFEFLRLVNIGATPVDLAGARFAAGVVFDFSASPVRYLNSGASVLVVKNQAAFQTRYGYGCDATVAGEYTGNLSNGGERLLLTAADGAAIRDFGYDDGDEITGGTNPLVDAWRETRTMDGSEADWSANDCVGWSRSHWRLTTAGRWGRTPSR